MRFCSLSGGRTDSKVSCTLGRDLLLIHCRGSRYTFAGTGGTHDPLPFGVPAKLQAQFQARRPGLGVGWLAYSDLSEVMPQRSCHAIPSLALSSSHPPFSLSHTPARPHSILPPHSPAVFGKCSYSRLSSPHPPRCSAIVLLPSFPPSENIHPPLGCTFSRRIVGSKKNREHHEIMN